MQWLVAHYHHTFVLKCPHSSFKVLPGTIRGTVLGFSARAPSNARAIEVTFGLPNFATSLSRVFKQVNPSVSTVFRIFAQTYSY